MYRFWEAIIEPTLQIIKPKTIVEIGSDYGFNTKNLINFCQHSDAILHVIDPKLKYDIGEWKKEYHDRVLFYNELSLNVLWKLEGIDSVLIDGDHNWYTVFNELKMLDKNAVKAERHFPLVMLHDIGWPYGRRDLYYNPETIPIAYRKPFKRSGMLLEQAALAEQGGLNEHLDNAIYENNQQNGVLTAVEDFLAGSSQQLQFIKIPGLYGLGIIYPDELLQLNPAFAAWIRELTASPASWALIGEIEKERIKTEVARQEIEREATEHKRQVAELGRQVKDLKEHLVNRDTELQTAKKEFHESLRAKAQAEDAAREKQERLQAEIEAQRKTAAELERQLQAETEAQLKIAAERERQLQEEVEARQAEVEKQRRLMQGHQRALAEVRERLAAQECQEVTIREKAETYRKNIQVLSETAKVKSNEVYTLARWMEQIRNDIDAMLGSWRWKVGDRAIRLTELAVFRRRVPMATDHLRSLFKDYEVWARHHRPMVKQPTYPLNEKKLHPVSEKKKQ